MASYYEAGLHLARVTRQGWTESKTKKPMLVFNIQILAKITKDQEGNESFEDLPPSQYDSVVRIVVDNANANMMDYAMKKLRYAGFTGDSFADLNLEGREIRVNNEPREHEGKEYDGFDLALPPLEAKATNPIDATAARKFDALFGRRLKDGAEPKAAPDPKPSRETVPRRGDASGGGGPQDDDSIPF